MTTVTQVPFVTYTTTQIANMENAEKAEVKKNIEAFMALIPDDGEKTVLPDGDRIDPHIGKVLREELTSLASEYE